MSGKHYSSNVRLGNWSEELFLEEDKIKRFMKKRERGELLVQKTRILFNNLLREVSLDLPEKFIAFGNVVQVIAPECCREGYPPGIVLSGLVSEKEVDEIQHFVDGCLVTGSTLLEPCVRNSFRICSPDKFQDGQPLKFGQYFNLCTVEPDPCQPLYVESEVPHIQSVLGRSKHPLLRLTDYKNIYCLWKALPLAKELREDLDGTNIPVNTRVVIRHVASNKNLAVDTHAWFTTFFGVECEITVHTYLNVYKREEPNNIWKLSTKIDANRLEIANMSK